MPDLWCKKFNSELSLTLLNFFTAEKWNKTTFLSNAEVLMCSDDLRGFYAVDLEHKHNELIINILMPINE
jgi:hypothetical protein